jgi:hypothetical protein
MGPVGRAGKGDQNQGKGQGHGPNLRTGRGPADKAVTRGRGDRALTAK